MIKIISYNVNGVRAALRKGFKDWLKAAAPHTICLQEVKAMEDQIDLSIFEKMGYKVIWNAAEKKGYSGTAVLTKEEPNIIKYEVDYPQLDREGRFIVVEFENLIIMNVYMPSGSNNSDRQGIKLDFLLHFSRFVEKLQNSDKELVVCGDFNICHLDIDIHNPKMNIKTPGWTPEERKWMQTFLKEQELYDAFRVFNSEPHNYTWWSYRARARPKNLGWRIDYQLVSKSLVDRLQSSHLLSEAFHSDHCPVCLNIQE